MKRIVCIIFLLCSAIVLKSQVDKRHLTAGYFYSSSLGGGMTIVKKSGPDIIKTASAYNYDIGLYSGYKFFKLKSKFTIGFSLGIEKYEKYFVIDIDLLKQYYPNENLFMPSIWRLSRISGGAIAKFYFDYYQTVMQYSNGRSIDFKIGFGFVSPVGERDEEPLYIGDNNFIQGYGFSRKYFLIYYYNHNYPFKKYYTFYSIGLEYSYPLWKENNISFLLSYNYIPAIYYYGKFETTPNSSFYYYADFYQNPSNFSFNIIFNFN